MLPHVELGPCRPLGGTRATYAAGGWMAKEIAETCWMLALPSLHLYSNQPLESILQESWGGSLVLNLEE